MSASELTMTTDAQLRLRNERIEFREGFCVVPIGATHAADDEITALRAEVARLTTTGEVVGPLPEWVERVREYAQHVVENWPQNKTTAVKAILNMFPAAPSSEEVEDTAPVPDHFHDVMKMVPAAEQDTDSDDTMFGKLLDTIAQDGGSIVSTNQLSEMEIAHARACGRMYVSDDGLGFVAVPPNFPDDTAARIERLEELLRKCGPWLPAQSQLTTDVVLALRETAAEQAGKEGGN